MPITREKFLKGDFKNKKHNENEHPVVIFLKENSKYAFTVKEIFKKAKLNHFTVRGILAKLRKNKLVLHKSPYFMWKK